MSYFHILQVSLDDQIKKVGAEYQINIPTSRFLEYTEENIRILFKIISQEKLDQIKKYPALIKLSLKSKHVFFSELV